MFEQGGDPEKSWKRGLKQASDDGFMIGIVEEVIKIILLLWKNLKKWKEKKPYNFLQDEGMERATESSIRALPKIADK